MRAPERGGWRQVMRGRVMSREAAVAGALKEAMSAAGLPGLVAAARLPSKEPFVIALGERGAENPAPMTPDTLFWIASCTKAITATASLLLVDEGLIGLDDPVAAALPALGNPSLLDGFAEDGRPRLKPATRPVTLRRLLTHTTGHAYAFTSPETARAGEALGLQYYLAEGPDQPLLFEPGQGWVYGIGLDWAAKLVEALTGEDFDAFLARRVLGPLGMDDTSFFPSPDQQARAAGMHARTPEGGLAPIPFSMPPERHFMMGGGGLWSTAVDYMKFLDFVLGRGPRLLSEESFRRLRSVEVQGPEVGVLKTSQPHTSNDYDPFPGAQKGWTLGFVANLEPGPNGRGAGSLAWGGLGNCYYWADPGSGIAGLFFAQLLPFADARVLAGFGGFERAVYGL